MRNSNSCLFGLVLALCVFGAYGLTSFEIYDNSPSQFFKNSYLIAWPVATTECGLKNLPVGDNNWVISVNDNLVGWGGCGVFANGTTLDFSTYTELEVTAFLNVAGAQHDDINEVVSIQMQLQDVNGHVASVQVQLIENSTILVYPLANFQGIDLSKITNFAINIYNINNVDHKRSAVIQRVRVTQRTIFRVFTDATSIAVTPPNGPNVLYSWADPNKPPCNPFTVDPSAPEGTKVLNIPSGTWGCGIQNIPMNLATIKSVKFWLRSRVDVLFELGDHSGFKVGITIPSTKNIWTSKTIAAQELTNGGLNLSIIAYQFMITKIGNSTAGVRVDNVRFSYV